MEPIQKGPQPSAQKNILVTFGVISAVMLGILVALHAQQVGAVLRDVVVEHPIISAMVTTAALGTGVFLWECNKSKREKE